MIISLIAAIGKNNELGKGNDLVFNLPADMKHFRDTTRGHTVIMGRKTFESIGKALPSRRNIVITRDTNYFAEGIDIVHSLEEALQISTTEQGRKFEENQEDLEVFVIGGGQIYADALPKAQRLYMTHVEATLSADTYFPHIDEKLWKKVSEEKHDKDSENEYAYTFILWEKK